MIAKFKEERAQTQTRIYKLEKSLSQVTRDPSIEVKGTSSIGSDISKTTRDSSI